MTRLAIARMHAGHLTIREAAERCGLNYASWSNWEQGSRPRNLLDVVQAISEGLDVDDHWLLFGGPLAPSARPQMHKRPGEATVRYPQLPVRPTDTRPKNRPEATQPRTTPGQKPRRPVRLTPLQVA